MRWRHHVVGSVRFSMRLVAFGALLLAVGGHVTEGQAKQEADTGAGSAIRIVHGVAEAGPLDVYIDGAIALIGIVFAETSGSLALESGEHEFAVVPTGAAADAAIAAGQITVQAGSQYFAALLGTPESASVGLYAIDDRQLDAGRARFRIISGVTDAGEIVPAFSGGEALSEPLGFGDASQYASIGSGVYDLDMLDAASGVSLLALQQTPIAEGTATDVILLGQVGTGSLQALVVPSPTEIIPFLGRSARIVAGSCEEPGPLVAELGPVQEGQGERVGVPDAPRVAQGFGLAPLSFATLVASPHAIAVSDTDAANGASVACGDIGGPLTDTGALVISLQTANSDSSSGIAVLAPALEDPETTGISVFTTAVGPAATPEPVSE